MRNRCLSPGNIGFGRYGGRGIRIDARWSDFWAFLSDMGERPVGLSLDRIDNDGPYTKDNCRWASFTEQCRNRRSSRFLYYHGERRTVTEWALELDIPKERIVRRLNLGWSDEDALTRPVIANKQYFREASA